MNQVTQSLSGEPLRLTSWYSPGSGGDYWKESNQLSLDVGEEGEEKEFVMPIMLWPELSALGREVWSRSLEGRERWARQAEKGEKPSSREAEPWP